MDIEIYVNKGTFSNINQAAFSEDTVDWWNESDNRAVHCTECFAAYDLFTYLEKLNKKIVCFNRISLLDISDKTFSECEPPDIPIKILIGNTVTNPLIAQLETEVCESISANEKVLYEGFRIKSFRFGSSIYFILSGNDRSGTLYAVYAFLEKIGIQKFGLGEKGNQYPKSFEISDELLNMDFIENPAYKTRGCYSEFLDDSNSELIEWAAFNRMNFIHLFKISNPHKLKKLGIKTSGGGHNILYRFMDPNQEYPYKHKLFGGEGKPEDPYEVSCEYKPCIEGDKKILTYSSAHPEWYNMIDGKRSFVRDYEKAGNGYFTGDNFCTSNPNAVNELATLIANDLASGELSKIDYLNFWMLDNGKWCQCDLCKSPESGNLSYKLMMLVYNIDKKIKEAQKLGKINRQIKILFPAYHETLEAPNKPLPEDFDYNNCHVIYFPIERCYVHGINDNNCTETNKWLMDRYLPWVSGNTRNYKGEVFIGEYYNVSSFAAMPFIPSRVISNDIPYYYDSGTRHFYYMHITSGKWGMLTLNNWLHAKLLWNPKENSDALKEKYFSLYYSSIASEMRDFYELLEKATANCKYLKHYQIVNGKIISLFSRISNALVENNETDLSYLFPLEHMQYDEERPLSVKSTCVTMIDKNSGNEGISLLETIEIMQQCRKLIDEALLKSAAGNIADEIVAERILEDDMRFTYGECMIQFIYHMVRTVTFIKTKKHKFVKASFDKVKSYAEILENMTEPVDNYTYGKEFKNGLTASWMEKAYVDFSELINCIKD